MFRYEIGAHILVRRIGMDTTTDVEILDKAPNRIKVRVLSDDWFGLGKIVWLSDDGWISVGRVKDGK